MNGTKYSLKINSSISVLKFIIILIVISNYNAPTSADLPQVKETLEWKLHRNLYDYRTYGAVTLERICVPPHTVSLNISINVQRSSDSCDVKVSKIFINQFGLPMVSRDNEAFPTNMFIPSSHLYNTSALSNNATVSWVLDNLREGELFLMAVMPPPDSRIKQQGLGADCDYFMSVKAKILFYQDEDIQQLQLNSSSMINLSGKVKSIVSFKVPVDAIKYSVYFNGCNTSSCSVSVFLLEALTFDIPEKHKQSCVWINGSCAIDVMYPVVNSFNYLLFVLEEKIQVNMSLQVKATYFDMDHSINDLTVLPLHDTKQISILAGDLGRETPASAEEGSNFYDHFAAWDDNFSPRSVVNVRVLDTVMVTSRFKLRTSDTGTTLKVYIHIPVEKISQMAHIHMCLSPHRLSSAINCTGGALNITTKKDENKQYVMVPYPQNGIWFISMQSQCFEVDKNTSEEITLPCKQYPIVNLTVHLSPCIDGGCGSYGSCKLYFGADILYSACNCYSGWRGYGCNDGSRAETASTEKAAVYLLTLSNLGFIPGIALAVYRRFYIEALVYTYNMFFSTFYHACDSSEVYQLCIMPYNALSFADFFASLLSFWVTLMVMARIPQELRSFLHMLSALFISLGVVYDRHGLIEQLLPIVGGVFIVLLSWGVQCYKKKSIFPSKMRLLKFILPGVVLACSGLIFNLALETQENYKYIHSMWHILVSASIMFLLPPRRNNKDKTGCLSVQSGDITRQQLIENDELQANILRADETDAGTPSEPSSPPETPSNSRGFKLRKVANNRRHSNNLVL